MINVDSLYHVVNEMHTELIINLKSALVWA